MTEAEHKSRTELRSNAEKTLASLEDIAGGTAGEDVQKLVQELRIHQIELEMQNAQLAASQAEIEKSRKKYSDLYDFAPVGYLSFDKDGLIVEANLAIATLLGTERRWMIDSPFQKYIVVADRDTFRLHLQKLSKMKERDKCEVKLRAVDGHELHALLDSLYVEDSEGKISYRTAVMDIAERKTAEEALQRAHDELEKRVADRTAELQRSNKHLQEFAFIASHDMQEPLRKVQTFGNRLLEKHGECLNEEGQDYLKRMLNATKRISGMVESLLTYSRVETKAEEFPRVDLTPLVEEVMGDLEISIKKSGARIEVEELPEIEADRIQMYQLFQNLIGNALKFRGKEAPLVRIRAELTAGTESARGGVGTAQWSIFVEDNGIGFDEKYLDRIFALFQRLHGRSEYEGTGMGLAICRRIVERHGGSIAARSKPGEGSTFIVTLPVSRPRES
jgi:PAS domain S-box-containing protein